MDVLPRDLPVHHNALRPQVVQYGQVLPMLHQQQSPAWIHPPQYPPQFQDTYGQTYQLVGYDTQMKPIYNIVQPTATDDRTVPCGPIYQGTHNYGTLAPTHSPTFITQYTEAAPDQHPALHHTENAVTSGSLVPSAIVKQEPIESDDRISSSISFMDLNMDATADQRSPLHHTRNELVSDRSGTKKRRLNDEDPEVRDTTPGQSTDQPNVHVIDASQNDANSVHITTNASGVSTTNASGVSKEHVKEEYGIQVRMLKEYANGNVKDMIIDDLEQNCTDSTIIDYFENPRFHWAFIKFANREAVEFYTSQKQPVDVYENKMFMSPLPSFLDNTILIENFPHSDQWTNLKKYIDKLSGCKVVYPIILTTRNRNEPTQAMLSFDGPVDIDDFKRKLVNESFGDHLLSVQSVPESDAVLIKDIEPDDYTNHKIVSTLQKEIKRRLGDTRSKIRYTLMMDDQRSSSNSRQESTPNQLKSAIVCLEDPTVLNCLPKTITIGHSQATITKYCDLIGPHFKEIKSRMFVTQRSKEFKFEMPIQFLMNEKIHEEVDAKLKQNGHRGDWHVNPDDPQSLKVLGTTPTVALTISTAIRRMIKTREKVCTPEETKYIKDSLVSFQQFVDEISTMVQGKLMHGSVERITVFGLENDVEEFLRRIEMELDDKVHYIEVIINEADHLQYLERRKLIDIRRQAGVLGCVISNPLNKAIRCPVTAQGTKTNLENFFISIRDELKDVEIDKYKVEYRYRMLPAGQVDLQIIGLEQLTNTIITRRFLTTKAGAASDIHPCQVPIDVSDQPCIELMGSYACNCTSIFVVKGDISRFRGSAIVNPANGDLRLGSGIAGVINRHGGPTVGAECANIVSNLHGKMAPGQVVSTTAGTMKCGRIIHAVGQTTTYRPFLDSKILRTTIRSVFNLAVKEHLTSICIPALSCGVFGHNKTIAIHSIVDETVQCLQKESGLLTVSQIYFIDNQSECSTIFNETCSAHELLIPLNSSGSNGTSLFSCEPNNNVPEQLLTTSPDSSDCESGVASTSTELEAEEVVHDPTYSQKLSDGVTIGTTYVGCVVFDDISCENVGVLVNSLGGRASKYVLEKAGSVVSNQVAQSNKKGIIITDGGSLVANQIYHVQIPAKAKSLKQLQVAVHKCISQAEKDKRLSIAFPALGTGAGGYPVQEIAKMFLTIFNDRFQPNKQSTLQSAVVLLHRSNIPLITAFGEEWGVHLSLPHVPLPVNPTASPDVDCQFDVKLKRQSVNQIEQIIMEFLQLTVTLYNGDIISDTADVLMCPSGPDPIKDLGAVGTMLRQKDEVQITSGLRKCSYTDRVSLVQLDTGAVKYNKMVIVNAVGAGNDPSLWDTLLSTALIMVDRDGCHNLAMPLIGTGNLKAGKSDMYSIIFKCLFKNQGFRNLAQLKLVLNGEDLDQTFQTLQLLVDTSTKTKQTTSPVAERLKSGISSIVSTAQSDKPTTTEQLDVTVRAKPESKMHLPEHYRIIGHRDGIEEAKKRLDSLFMEILPMVNIDGYPEVVCKLSDVEMKRIKEDWVNLTDSNHCTVEIDIEMGVITITGVKCDKLKLKILKFLGDKSKSDAVALNVQWVKIDGKLSTIIEKLASYEIEASYQTSGGTGTYRLQYSDMTVDFDRNVITIGTRSFKLKRSALDGIKLVPNHWKHTDLKDQDIHEIQVATESTEFKQIQDMVHRSAPKIDLKRVVRIENVPRMYQYMASRNIVEQRLLRQGNGAHVAEKLLFHGTMADSIEKIKTECFNRAFAGDANMTKYGYGTYFARDFTYSERYSKDVKKMFVARVITGEWCQGDKDYKVPPFKPNNSNERFDCVVDNETSPSIYVVFSDNAAYPEYIIEW